MGVVGREVMTEWSKLVRSLVVNLGGVGEGFRLL